MKAIWKLNKNNNNNNNNEETIGALTDGLRWRFYVLAQNGFHVFTTQTLHHDNQCPIILGMLRYMVRGKVPKGVTRKF